MPDRGPDEAMVHVLPPPGPRVRLQEHTLCDLPWPHLFPSGRQRLIDLPERATCPACLAVVERPRGR